MLEFRHNKHLICECEVIPDTYRLQISTYHWTGRGAEIVCANYGEFDHLSAGIDMVDVAHTYKTNVDEGL